MLYLNMYVEYIYSIESNTENMLVLNIWAFPPLFLLILSSTTGINNFEVRKIENVMTYTFFMSGFRKESYVKF